MNGKDKVLYLILQFFFKNQTTNSIKERAPCTGALFIFLIKQRFT
ncbi:hypothetical protein M472_11960 [Sphingobacterium paucimobilis HER1398]|uniref:Uncharacterized protein n=1 Tax=Sphingobacterium paucimobilis HER1398 TaxID=1346330 RepID=U2HVD7_9SPHI|nr:hypothetical protein M472_11960 [Sphingobacterium paucimobilis HER1398]